MTDVIRPLRAYHFVGDTLRDGRPVPADGVWLEHDGLLEMCISGLHASQCPFDALTYAPGFVLCLVEVDGEMIEQGDKLVARRRRIVSRVDATELLRLFAGLCALDVIDRWDAPNKVVKEYLTTGNESLWAAARDAAWNAALAAGAAAWAARDAAWNAARDAARDKYRNKFVDLVENAFAKNSPALHADA